MPQKKPNVSYHLQTAFPVTTSVAYHLRKKVGGYGWAIVSAPIRIQSTPRCAMDGFPIAEVRLESHDNG
jgi:hypothetical protein